MKKQQCERWRKNGSEAVTEGAVIQLPDSLLQDGDTHFPTVRVLIIGGLELLFFPIINLGLKELFIWVCAQINRDRLHTRNSQFKLTEVWPKLI